MLVRERESVGFQLNPETGLIVASNRKSEMVYGTVLQVGSDLPEPIGVGEIVHWRRHFGIETEFGTVLHYDSIDAVEVCDG